MNEGQLGHKGGRRAQPFVGCISGRAVANVSWLMVLRQLGICETKYINEGNLLRTSDIRSREAWTVYEPRRADDDLTHGTVKTARIPDD